MDPPLHTYIPLRNQRAIRLFKLLTDWSHESPTRIKIRLEQYDLNSSPPYHAVSYVWGSETRDVPIRCGDGWLSITPNCFYVLDQMSREKFSQFVWVDSICINQEDVEERSQQVAIMDQVYRRAVQVDVWLGFSTPASEEVMFRVAKIGMIGLGSLLPGFLGRSVEKRRRRYVSELLEQRYESQYGQLPFGLIGEFLSYEWFERMWVVQEVVLRPASSVWLRCGPKTISLELLNVVFDLILDESSKSSTFSGSYRLLMSKIGLLRTLRWAVEMKAGGSDHSFSISELLTQLTGKKATDSADKVFGCYGICKYLGWDIPKPDYRKPLHQIYTEISRRAIDIDQNLDLLYIAGRSTTIADLPSWVPDYSLWTTTPTADFDSMSTSGDSLLEFSFGREGRALLVKGHILDTVESCGPSVKWGHSLRLDESVTDEILTQNVSTLGIWERMSLSLRQLAHQDDDLEIQFASTVFYDGLMPRNREEAVRLFQDWKLVEHQILGEQVIELTNAQMRRGMTAINENIGRSFFVTRAGRMGTAPAAIRPFDEVIAIAGVSIPYIVRWEGKGWRLIGFAYLHGVMDGEAWPEDHAPQSFTFI